MLQAAWYSNKSWVWILLPLTCVFFVLSLLRRALFKVGLFASSKPSAFVIIVGNISVGGNGKTPTVIAIAEHLSAKGYRCGVLSRGYGGSQREFPHLLTSKDKPSVVGDEPKLMQQRLSCPVVIDPKRFRGATFLSESQECEVIICDDGLQHYALKRDFELVVMDSRGVGNGHLMPMGPLRESKARLKTVDAVVINGDMPTGLLLEPSKLAYLSLQPKAWVNVRSSEVVDSLPEGKPTALAGIGDPQRFFNTLSSMGVDCIDCIGFPDHHDFSRQDIPDSMVVMTEKDAVKCQRFAHENCWYLQVSGNISENLYQLIEEKLAVIKR